jgi:putative hydrolase of the HAD superfamily
MEKALVKPYLHPLTPRPTGVKPNGRLRLPVDCLLCDLYGTLFISNSGDIGMATGPAGEIAMLDQLLARYRQTITAPKLLDQMHQAIEHAHAQARARGVAHPEVVIESIWQELLAIDDAQMVRRFAVEFEMITNPVWPMPGIEKLLAACRENKIHLGILSNAQFYTPYLFAWLLGQDAKALGFDPQLTFYSFRLGQAKPAAALFEMARQRLKELGIAPSAVAYLGNDMHKDIVPAHTAGFQTILFAGDRRSLRLHKEDTTCTSLAPDMVVTRLDQLTACLQ